MYLFVCFDLVICSRIDGFFGISTLSVLILVFHELGILCMRVKYLKKNRLLGLRIFLLAF